MTAPPVPPVLPVPPKSPSAETVRALDRLSDISRRKHLRAALGDLAPSLPADLLNGFYWSVIGALEVAIRGAEKHPDNRWRRQHRLVHLDHATAHVARVAKDPLTVDDGTPDLWHVFCRLAMIESLSRTDAAVSEIETTPVPVSPVPVSPAPAAPAAPDLKVVR